MKRVSGFTIVLVLAASSAVWPAMDSGEEWNILFFEDFETYPEGADLSGGGYGGWIGRWGRNITVTSEEAVSSQHCAKMDNGGGC